MFKPRALYLLSVNTVFRTNTRSLSRGSGIGGSIAMSLHH